MSDPVIQIDSIDALVFDFDGVLTDNKVYVDQDGNETVSCHRGDGLASDTLRKIEKPCFIMSTEKNPVVMARAKKLRVPVVQGVRDKVEGLTQLAEQEKIELSRVLYMGNDLNDFLIMGKCGYSVCPADAHEKIKAIASIVLTTTGGNGVVRELLENVFQLDLIDILYIYIE